VRAKDKIARLGGAASVVIGAALLQGCAGLSSSVNAYDGPDRKRLELATIAPSAFPPQTVEHGRLIIELISQIQSVDNVDWHGEWLGYPRKVNVLPGLRTIKARCDSGQIKVNPDTPTAARVFLTGAYMMGYGSRFTASPTVDETLEAGHNYVIECYSVWNAIDAKGNNKIGVRAIDLGVQPKEPTAGLGAEIL
jgi:hypothetical protein